AAPGSRVGLAYPGEGVARLAPHAHLPMEVRASREPGSSDEADDVAAVHLLTNNGVDLPHVKVVADEAVTVVDRHPPALDGVRASHHYDAVVGRVYGRALRSAEVEAVVEGGGTALFVASGVPKATGRHALDRHDERCGPSGIRVGASQDARAGLGL